MVVTSVIAFFGKMHLAVITYLQVLIPNLEALQT